MSLQIRISIGRQTLTLLGGAGEVLRVYSVSTAAKGPGELSGSHCTPRGRHLVRARIGTGQPENTVFVARRPTGEIYSRQLGEQFPRRDWILTRILWLSSCEATSALLVSASILYISMAARASLSCALRMKTGSSFPTRGIETFPYFPETAMIDLPYGII